MRRAGFSLFLEHDDGVSLEVTEIKALALLDEGRVLPAEEPSNMGKEKTAFRIVRIRIRFRIFVMDAVISTPFMDAILECHGLHEG